MWKDILEQFCDRTHSQYGMVAISQACMVIVNKKIWKAFLEFWSHFLAEEYAKRKSEKAFLCSSKEDFAKQTSSLKSFSVASRKQSPNMRAFQSQSTANATQKTKTNGPLSSFPIKNTCAQGKGSVKASNHPTSHQQK